MISKTFQHINRCGDVYYLQSKQNDKGQLKYNFTRKLTETPVAELPAGYEVREHPESAQIFIRKIKPSKIRPEEKQLLERIIREQTDGLLFIVDIEDRSLVVYTSEMDADARIAVLRQVVPMDPEAARRMKSDMTANARYIKMMRFTLIHVEDRWFNMDRWCFMGGIDDWYFIDGDQPLSVLAKKYVRHLGQESFFELM